jgi:hypothetical protein
VRADSENRLRQITGLNPTTILLTAGLKRRTVGSKRQMEKEAL